MDVFKEALREIEIRHNKAKQNLDARINFLQNTLPGLREIDKELADIGLGLAKIALGRGDDRSAEDLRRASEDLGQARRRLLYENGYDESYFDEVFNCALCKDTGRADGAHCACLRQRVVAKYYEMSNLSQILDKENFDTFNVSYYSADIDENFGMSPRENIQRIWTASLKFVENFDTKFENLLLHGSTGLGKTFLSNCIAKELLDRGKTVLYTTSAQLFKIVEEHRFGRKKAGPGYLDLILDVDLLIIDDLGTEFPTVVTTSELFNFINTRLLSRKHTIISTNLDPSDFEENYSDRITSRLYGEYVAMRFFGDDIRISKKYRQT